MSERQYSFFVRIEFAGRVKAFHGSKLGEDGQRRAFKDGQRRAFTPAVILFIALPEPQDNSAPG